MKRTILLSLFTLLLVPAVAMAEPPAAAPVPAVTAASQGCGSGLDFLAAAPVTPAGGSSLPALSPLANAEPTAADCCTARRIACAAGCTRCGVFEFSCDAASCQGSCICNIC